jgi:hypothetical protein
VAFATALARETHAPTAAAVGQGRVLAEQAQVILTAVDALPASVTPGDRAKAEQHRACQMFCVSGSA